MPADFEHDLKLKHFIKLYKNSRRLDGGCLEWTGRVAENGYGVLRVGKTHAKVHRIMFFLDHGYCPALVMHKCDNRLCIESGHLLEGTQKENVADAFAKGRRWQNTVEGRAAIAMKRFVERSGSTLKTSEAISE